MDSFYKALVFVVGLPCLNTTYHGTIYPLQDVARYRDVAAFRARKSQEHQYMSLAAVTCLTAGIGVMQWPLMQNPYSWTAPALVYCSIIESCFVGGVSFHQRALLQSLTESEHFLFDKDRLTWKTIYLWQVPNMMLIWSAAFLLAGISFGICFALTPPQDHADDGRNIAIFYVALFSLNFIHYIWYVFQMPLSRRGGRRDQERAAWVQHEKCEGRPALDLSKSSATLVATTSMNSMV